MYIFTQGISYHFERNPTSEKKNVIITEKKCFVYTHVHIFILPKWEAYMIEVHFSLCLTDH